MRCKLFFILFILWATCCIEGYPSERNTSKVESTKNFRITFSSYNATFTKSFVPIVEKRINAIGDENDSALIYYILFGWFPPQTEYNDEWLKKGRAKILERHNRYRAKHHSNPLVRNEQINKVSQQYAEYLRDTDKFEHSGGPYGENLALSWTSDTKQEFELIDSIDEWYDEIKSYSFSDPEGSTSALHFTQLVWAGSKEIGIGIAIRRDARGSKCWIVCNYNPPGNVKGQFRENVHSSAKSLSSATATLFFLFIFGVYCHF